MFACCGTLNRECVTKDAQCVTLESPVETSSTTFAKSRSDVSHSSKVATGSGNQDTADLVHNGWGGSSVSRRSPESISRGCRGEGPGVPGLPAEPVLPRSSRRGMVPHDGGVLGLGMGSGSVEEPSDGEVIASWALKNSDRLGSLFGIRPSM
ncbi:hypothetical protein EYF80_010023 [Liparis tanakae]|uniref:Uncharacterized protein n=1 Tax=Liparis tanakae TaxID=230148 RepID=A0A4Z2IP43_9TELE|nr:hypothetical protein EYF80_010023 [Liparis tanakae]